MSFRELRIFLSSTSEFAAIRERITAHVRPMQHIRLDYMEDFGALPPLTECYRPSPSAAALASLAPPPLPSPHKNGERECDSLASGVIPSPRPYGERVRVRGRYG